MAYMYFAKVNVNSEEIYDVYKKKVLLDDILRDIILRVDSKVSIDLPKNKGCIKFITINKDERMGYITGRVVKIFSDEIKIYDKEADDLIDLPNDKLARTATFYFDVNKEIIAFTTGQYLGTNQFCNFFELLLNEHIGRNLFKVVLLKNEDGFRERLKLFRKILKVDLTLVPKNPGAYEFKKMYANPESIVQVGATQYRQEFSIDKKSSNGLNMDNEFMNNAILGVSSGYGDMKVEGIGDDGEKMTVNSCKDVVEKKSIPDNSKHSITYIHEQGKSAIVGILAKAAKRIL